VSIKSFCLSGEKRFGQLAVFADDGCRLLQCFEFIKGNVDVENMFGTVFACMIDMEMPCESEAGQV